MISIARLAASSFIFLSLVSASHAEERLIFAVDLIRHGDRTPIHETIKEPYLWPEGLGQLTPEGVNRSYNMGAQLRRYYVEETQLLPENFNVETLYVASTNKDRTLMSAQAFLMGLYPSGTGPKLVDNQPSVPFGMQPIPVHSVPKEVDHLSTPKSYNPMFLFDNYLEARHEWKKVPKETKEKIKRWGELTGLPLKNLKGLKGLADILYVRQQNNIPLPSGITDQDVQEIIHYGKGLMVGYFKLKANSYPAGHGFLMSTAKYLDDASKDKTKLKYVLFSAHDSSIMSVMNTLGAPLEEIPPYSSRVNVALYEDNQQYNVKLSYNGNPINVPACKGSTCTLEEFMSLAKK